jgi:trans-aconitate methyltransferase
MGESASELFGSVAMGYAKHRPSYPESFFRQFADSCPGHELVWDCGCGNGQAALALTSYFNQVVTTDASQEQLNQAVIYPQVSYRQAMANASGLADVSVDGVVVAAAAHCLAGGQFNGEVQWVARPGAVMARLLTQRAVKPLHRCLLRLRQFSLDASMNCAAPMLPWLPMWRWVCWKMMVCSYSNSVVSKR